MKRNDVVYVIIITRRHVGGTIWTKTGLKCRIPQNIYCKIIY